MKRELELLAPAGSLETLKSVIAAGADAVYFGGDKFGARAYAKNFSREEAIEAIDYGHIHEKKVILAVNTLFKEEELCQRLYDYLLPFYERGLDAVIVQDFGVMQFIRKQFPKLPIHASTQMTVTGAAGANFLYEQGAKRIVTARELTLEEIAAIHTAVPVELESFIHGALCYCYSGACLFSSIVGGRSGNRGRCAQPCRLPYGIYDSQKHLQSGREEMYPLSPKDLCTIGMLPKLAESGVYSFKIEGRMKQTEYAAGVVSIYRKYMDLYLKDGKSACDVTKEDQKRLFDLGNRSGFTDGYYETWNDPEMITWEKPNHTKKADSPKHQPWQQLVETKEKIKGNLKIKKDLKSILTVFWKEHSVTVEGMEPVAAKKQPLTLDSVSGKVKKTGNTPFVFDNLEIELSDNLFLPVQALNELRREALERLSDCILTPYFREKPARLEQNLPWKSEDSNGNKNQMEPCLTVSVEQQEQLHTALSNSCVSEICLDSLLMGTEEETVKSIRKIQTGGKCASILLPAVFRLPDFIKYESWDLFRAGEQEGVLPDYFVAKNYDSLGFLLSHGIPAGKIRLDHSLYTWSNEAQSAFSALGLCHNTVPLELNKQELKARDNRESELQIYGRLPLMTSAQCLKKNTMGCDREKSVFYLKDRYGIYFPVKNNCNSCYNTIYNSLPLILFGCASEIKELGVRRYRISFTTETAAEAERVLLCYEETFLMGKEWKTSDGKNHFTYGHFKRGVE